MAHGMTRTVATMSLVLAASPAFAHVGVGDISHFSSGFFHPLLGLDHVLAMVAVGLYASQLGRRNVWLVPFAFVSTMIVGGLLGYNGVPLPHVEQGIGASVVIMGVAIAAGLELPTVAAMGLVASFALFHGHAHGNEGVGAGMLFLPYAAGFIVATTALHCVGICIGLGLKKLGGWQAELLQRAVGAIGALTGVALLAGWVSA